MKNAALFAVLLLVLAGPIALRPKATGQAAVTGERTLIIITPQNEAISYEFGRAFQEHYARKTGRRMRVDWRTPGGTGEIARAVRSEFLAAFEVYWKRERNREWNREIAASFDDAEIQLDDTPADDTPAQAARRAFLHSNIGGKLDLFFGGGAFDFEQQARAGRLVDSGFLAAHPEIFGPGGIPQKLGGEPFCDPQGRWIGAAVASFGIVYNADSLARLGIRTPPTQWSDLADPRFRCQIALANPTQSSSVNKAFEMVIQQQMLRAVAAAEEAQTAGASPEEAVRTGWAQAMQLLMKIGANARYFTDSSTKIALDVEAGEASAGMTIDFYGRFQSEAVRRPDGSSRLQYADVVGGSSFGVDPIGLFRGAPNADVAKEFIAFVLSPEGQMLWNWKVGAPGGPEKYALRRLPVLPSLYAPEFQQFRSDPQVNPYDLAQSFTYHEEWTGRLFRSIAFIFRVMCIDPHDELTDAWQALIGADFPPEAMAVFSNVGAVNYTAASGRIRDALAGDKIQEVQLARSLAAQFREQYRRAAELARAGR